MTIRAGHAPPGYNSWPHPRRSRTDDPVDPRLTKVIRRAMRTNGLGGDQATAQAIADQVWAWLAQGD